MKLKKLKVVEFNSEKKLLLKCYADFYKSKTTLISGGNTFNFFLKYLYKKNIKYKKNLILFDERISNLRKEKNFYKLNKYLINKNILKTDNFLNFEVLKDKVNINRINLLKKKISNFPEADMALIGVGNDGHIGSIFPNIKKRYKNLLICKNKGEKFNRISFDLNYVKKIKKIIIVIRDKNKKNILKKILSNVHNSELPVLKLIKIASNKIYLYYTKNST